MRKAFSLVELSIVLVILGLLTGGILTGQSLIRAAELRAISTEYTRYATAVRTFRDKYFALPGDMANATSFWTVAGGNGSDATCAAVEASGPETCNGNGNGRLEDLNDSAWVQNENFRFWQHLANAGLIEGTFTGSGDQSSAFTNKATSATSGINVPASRFSNGMWVVEAKSSEATSMTPAGDGSGINYGNLLMLGQSPAEFYANIPGIVEVDELWNLDTKMDDGMPHTGKLMARSLGFCATPTDRTDTSSVYDFDGTSKCVPTFVRAF